MPIGNKSLVTTGILIPGTYIIIFSFLKAIFSQRNTQKNYIENTQNLIQNMFYKIKMRKRMEKYTVIVLPVSMSRV